MRKYTQTARDAFSTDALLRPGLAHSFASWLAGWMDGLWMDVAAGLGRSVGRRRTYEYEHFYIDNKSAFYSRGVGRRRRRRFVAVTRGENTTERGVVVH